jgi:hypothetical protein
MNNTNEQIDHPHAAMCIYCGEAVIYDTRAVTDMAAAHRTLMEHDASCARNPLAARVRELEAALTHIRDDDPANSYEWSAIAAEALAGEEGQ